MSSRPAGKPCRIGQVIEALETKVNDKGVTRVRYSDGWISENAGDGTPLLETMVVGAKGKGKDTAADENRDETESDAETDSTEESNAESKGALPKFKVAQRAVLRSGFEMTSRPAGEKPLNIVNGAHQICW